MLGQPVDPVVVGQRLLDVRGGADVPCRPGELDQRVLLRSPAEWILVAIGSSVDQQTALFEVVDDDRVGVFDVLAGKNARKAFLCLVFYFLQLVCLFFILIFSKKKLKMESL